MAFHSILAGKGGVATAAVEIDSITAVRASSSDSTRLAAPSKLRVSVAALPVGLDVRFRVLMDSDKSAVSMGRVLANQVSSGLLGIMLESEVRSRLWQRMQDEKEWWGWVS